MFVSVSREASECRLYAEIAQIRPGSNPTRSFVNASSKCSDAGSVWPASTSSRSDLSSCRSPKRGTKMRA
jgi:hypothetical protein